MVFLSCVSTAKFIISAHPQQHVFFSSLAGGLSRAIKYFEIGYWGPEFRESLEYVLAHDKRPTIKFTNDPVPFLINLSILSPEQRRRIKIEPIQQADYYIYNYYSAYYNPTNQPVYFSREVYGIPITKVYKIEKPIQPGEGIKPQNWQ